MTDKYITEFDADTTPSSTDAILIDQGAGAYKYATIANIKATSAPVVGTTGTFSGAVSVGGNINSGTQIRLFDSTLTDAKAWLATTSGHGYLRMFNSSVEETVQLNAGTGLTLIGIGASIGGDVSVVGDISNVPWTDYSSTSTITGFANATPATTAILNYKKVGNLVFFNWNLADAYDGTVVSFTLPYTAVAGASFGGIQTTMVDNSVALNVPGKWFMTSNSGLVTCRTNMSTATWTASGNRGTSGSGWYEAN